MTIRHLRIFITVAECKKMNLAAKKLYITQPTVSQAIRELEEHYGVKLFARLSKKLFQSKKLSRTIRCFGDFYEGKLSKGKP